MQNQESDDKKLKKEKIQKEKIKPPIATVEQKEKPTPQECIETKEKISKINLGEINIPSEVLAIIVSRIVSNISGVAGIVQPSKSGFGTLLGVKEIGEGVKVDLTEGKTISAYISVIVEHGSIIIDLAKKIQSVVKNEIEEKTGLLVKSIDVNVMGLNLSDKNYKPKQINQQSE